MTARAKRILLAGSWTWAWYEQACADALCELGHTVLSFSSFDRFHRWGAGPSELMPLSLSTRFQNRLSQGPAVWRMNRALERDVARVRPDVLFLHNCRLVLPSTVKRIRHHYEGVCIVQYSNDNLFSRHPRPDIYRHIRRAIPHADLNLAYRHEDLKRLSDAGAQHVGLLRSYFVPKEDFAVNLDPADKRFSADVVFAGHFEPDTRVHYLEHLLRRSPSLRFNLFGGGWPASSAQISPDSPLRPYIGTRPAVGDDYRKALCGAKIALCFLSTNNRDTYTRRNFQIPAMGTFQLAQYTDDLASLFREGVEIEFFRDAEELTNKVTYYLKHGDARARIAAAGRVAVWRGEHHVNARMASLMYQIACISNRQALGE